MGGVRARLEPVGGFGRNRSCLTMHGEIITAASCTVVLSMPAHVSTRQAHSHLEKRELWEPNVQDSPKELQKLSRAVVSLRGTGVGGWGLIAMKTRGCWQEYTRRLTPAHACTISMRDHVPHAHTNASCATGATLLSVLSPVRRTLVVTENFTSSAMTPNRAISLACGTAVAGCAVKRGDARCGASSDWFLF